MAETNREYLLGVDIGGTFTDFVLYHIPSGRVWLEKRLTTPDQPERAVNEGLASLMQEAQVRGENLDMVIHGTTLITNALIERKGAKTALLATDGYRDVLEIGTEMRYDSYDLFLEKPEPLVPRPLRFDVPERLKPSGEVYRPLDKQAVVAIARKLSEQGVESVAVSFLHSFINPAHEQQVRAVIARELPGVTVSISSEVAPEIREYQRTSTTVANAYVQPIAIRYVKKLQGDLAVSGYKRPLYLMLSSGGIITHEAAAQFPIRVVESGPAAGALATTALGERLGRKNLLSFDMGGTTAKACLIDDGAPTTSKEFEVARVRRFVKGSGLPLQVPVIEMIEIGAGGGSIARVDDMGLLKVGPDSAGSVPGPVCYGLGGTQPTVTDADLFMGYLDPLFFLGGRMSLDLLKTEAALKSLGKQLGTDAVHAARGIQEVVNTNMIAAAKMHMAERGRDPRRYAMVAFGGMGPMHAHMVAAGLKIRDVICPASAGVLSAWGMLVAPTAFEFARSLMAPLDELAIGRMKSVFAQMEGDGERMLQEAGVNRADMHHVRSLDMRYSGQTREITVRLPFEMSGVTVEATRAVFLAEYARLYGHAHTDVPIHVITCRLTSTSAGRSVTNKMVVTISGEARKGQRPVYFNQANDYVPTAVYNRYLLAPGTTFPGPAVVEERESTVVMPPGTTGHVDSHLNLVFRFEEGE